MHQTLPLVLFAGIVTAAPAATGAIIVDGTHLYQGNYGTQLSCIVAMETPGVVTCPDENRLRGATKLRVEAANGAATARILDPATGKVVATVSATSGVAEKTLNPPLSLAWARLEVVVTAAAPGGVFGAVVSSEPVVQ
ncbi:MAG TPA: hypothetical protein VNZ52_15960 [Candidatus Thermoplasmatota archaeon]|nr:hypothetical protein [Candidatus Thermoplasmatota archaeon]